MRLAVTDAVPGASAVNEARIGTQPMPGTLGQFVGRGSVVVVPSWRNTPGADEPDTVQ